MAELYRDGFTLKQIGERFGLSKQAVDSRFKRLGIERRRLKRKYEVDKKTLEKLYLSDKLSLKKIAEKFGISYTTVERALKFYKIPKRRWAKKTGKYQEFLNGLEIGEKAVIAVTAKNPHVVMHKAAKINEKKISMRKIQGNQFEITRRN